jgi:hypothetical protein
MAIALESLPGDSLHGLDRPQLALARSAEMYRLHRHFAIMHQQPVMLQRSTSIPVVRTTALLPELWPPAES